MATDTEQSQPRSPISAVVVGLVVALFGSPLLGRLNLSARLGTSTSGSLLLNAVLMWSLVAAVLAIVVYWEKRPLASIGLEMPTRREATLGVAAGAAGLLLGILMTGVAVATFQLEQPATLSTLAALPVPVKLAVVATAVVTEEVLWRGYPIERLAELTGSVWAGAVTSFVVFLAVHYPTWGVVGAIPQAAFTLALVGVYVRTRNVVVSIVAHAVINVVMVLVVPALV